MNIKDTIKHCNRDGRVVEVFGHTYFQSFVARTFNGRSIPYMYCLSRCGTKFNKTPLPPEHTVKLYYPQTNQIALDLVP